MFKERKSGMLFIFHEQTPQSPAPTKNNKSENTAVSFYAYFSYTLFIS